MSDFYVVYQNYEVYSISSVTPPQKGTRNVHVGKEGEVEKGVRTAARGNNF